MTLSRALWALPSRRNPGFVDEGAVLEIGDDSFGELTHRGDDVGEPCVDGASGHAVEFGRGGVLHEDHPRFLLDGLEAHGAVGAHARENDADAPLPPVVRQGAEEEVDGQAQTPGRGRIEQVECAVEERHVLVGRYHVDAVRLDYCAVLDLDDRHGGGALEELRHDALVRRVQVLDDDEGHAACSGHVLQELIERLQPSGGGADAHDGEGPLPVPGLRLFCCAGTGSLLLPFCFRTLCHDPPLLLHPDRMESGEPILVMQPSGERRMLSCTRCLAPGPFASKGDSDSYAFRLQRVNR